MFKKKNVNNGVVQKKYSKVKIGLALGGGATRGLAHIGAIKAFEEYGIKFDFVAGTSAGSLIGAFYAAGKTADEMKEMALTVKEKDIRTSKIVLVPSKTLGLENLIINNLGNIDIADLPMPFSPVIVDLKSTEEIALRRGNLAKAVAGSCAIPGVFTPVEFNDRLLADGGLQNTIPSDIPKLFGCDYVVAIDVNASRSYGTDSDKIFDVMSAAIRILMKSNAIKGYVYGDVVITPNLKQFKSTSLQGAEEMINQGYIATKQVIPQIIELFNKKPIKKKFKKDWIFARQADKVIESEYDINLLKNIGQEETENDKEEI